MIKTLPISTLDERYIDKFWSRVGITAEDSACWEWQAGCNKDGYGAFSTKDHHFRSHRLSYFLSFGVDPNDLYVLHKCDNRKCVNPKHLFLGTAKENSMDMLNKGRHIEGHKTKPEAYPKGSKHWNAKLNEDDVIRIREQYKNGVKCSPLAKENNVTYALIHYIVHGKSWKQLICN